MAAGDSFLGLRQFMKDKIDKYTLYDIDKSIEEIKTNYQNKGQSKIRIKVENNGVLKMLGLSDDDIWFYNNVTGPYSNYEFESLDSVENHFIEGSSNIWFYFDEENIELAKEISKYIYPKNFDVDDEKFLSVFASKLLQLFPKETISILRDFVYEKNNEMTVTASESMNSAIEDETSNLGIKFIDSELMEISLADLFNLYIKHNLPHLTIKELLKEVLPEETNFGGFYDNTWEYQDDDNFDKDSFNRTIKNEFEKILETIQENYSDWGEYKNMVDEITKKFYLDHWYPIPKTNDFLFSIDGFDKNDKKIIVKIRRFSGNKIMIYKFSLDNFYRLLYQPELFKFEDLYNI